jgi:hypothetical protein
MGSKYGKLPSQIDSLLVGSRRKQPTDFNQSNPIQRFARRPIAQGREVLELLKTLVPNRIDKGS